MKDKFGYGIFGFALMAAGKLLLAQAPDASHKQELFSLQLKEHAKKEAIEESESVVFNPTIDYFTKPISKTAKITDEDHKQILCLAENLYFEARNQSLKGLLGVAYVTLNRVKSLKFKNNYCGVVFQKIKHTCQFSWVCDGTPKVVREPQRWEDVKIIATNFYLYNHYYKDVTNGSLFYHTKKVHPKWKNVVLSTVIGDHIFYKEKKNEY